MLDATSSAPSSTASSQSCSKFCQSRTRNSILQNVTTVESLLPPLPCPYQHIHLPLEGLPRHLLCGGDRHRSCIFSISHVLSMQICYKCSSHSWAIYLPWHRVRHHPQAAPTLQPPSYLRHHHRLQLLPIGHTQRKEPGAADYPPGCVYLRYRSDKKHKYHVIPQVTKYVYRYHLIRGY